MFEVSSEQNLKLQEKALAEDIFAPEYLENLRKEAQAKIKPSKAILEALKQTNELNEKLRVDLHLKLEVKPVFERGN